MCAFEIFAEDWIQTADLWYLKRPTESQPLIIGKIVFPMSRDSLNNHSSSGSGCDSAPTPEVHGSNPVISKLLYGTFVYCQLYWKDENKQKEAGNGPFLFLKNDHSFQARIMNGGWLASTRPHQSTTSRPVWPTEAAPFASRGQWLRRGGATWRTGGRHPIATPIRWKQCYFLASPITLLFHVGKANFLLVLQFSDK